MKGFINVKTQGGLQRLLSIDKITSVFELANGKAFIETQTNKRSGYGFETLESFSEVIEKLYKSGEVLRL